MAALPPQAINLLSLLPSMGTIGGGVNALNQAAFGNIPARANPFGILPTPPTATVPTMPIPGAGGGGGQLLPGQQPPSQPGGSTGNNPFQQGLNKLGFTMPAGRGEAAQGGAGVGSTAANEAIGRMLGTNVASAPNLSNALRIGTMVAGGPMGLIGGALSAAVKPFGDSGVMLSQDAMARVQAAFSAALNAGATNIDQAMVAAQARLDVERALAGGSQIGGPGPGLSAGTGVDRLGHAYASNIGGAGVSHNLAGGGGNAGGGGGGGAVGGGDRGTYGGGGDPGAQGAGSDPHGPPGSQ